MIRIEVTEPDTQEWHSWRAECDVEQEALNRAREHNIECKVKPELYKGKKHGILKSFFFADAKPFHRKCSYCEIKIYPGQSGDVEHFRPKGGVTDLNDKPIVITVDGKRQAHGGYYWLAYDWRNMLPACSGCNRPDTDKDSSARIGKRNRFPVMNEYAVRPGDEVNEQPLLINPASPNDIDDPRIHLELSREGSMIARSPRGGATITALGLNERDLPTHRKKVYDDVRKKVGILYMAISMSPESVQNSLNELMRYREGSEAHSLAGRAAIDDYEADRRSTTTALYQDSSGTETVV